MKSMRWVMALSLLMGATGVPADRPDEPGRRTTGGGGASPPTLLNSTQQAALQRVLAPYKPETLSAADVRAILLGLDAAGLPQGPALDVAMARKGFSRKRMQALLPMPPPPTEAPASPAGRKFPRPQ